MSPSDSTSSIPIGPVASSHVSSDKMRRSLFSTTTQINIALLCIGFLLLVALWITEFLTSIVVVLAAALVVSYLLLGPVRFIETLLHKALPKQRRLSSSFRKTFAILCVYLLFLALLIITILRIAPALTLQVKEATQDIPAYLSSMEQAAGQHAPQVPGTPPERGQASSSSTSSSASSVGVPHDIAASKGIEEESSTAQGASKVASGKSRLASRTGRLALQKMTELYRQHVSSLGNLILDLGGTTVAGIVYTLTTLVLVFYLLHDGKKLKEGFVNLMPRQSRDGVTLFLHRVHVQFYSIVKGQVLMSFLSGGLIYLLLLTQDVKYALLFGIFFGVMSILPILGPWLGLIPITFILTFSGHPLDILQVLLVAGLFYLVKVYWLWPQIIHRKFDIHPILFILTFLICLKLVGFWGILLSFPLASTLAVAIDMLKASHQIKAASQ